MQHSLCWERCQRHERRSTNACGSCSFSVVEYPFWEETAKDSAILSVLLFHDHLFTHLGPGYAFAWEGGGPTLVAYGDRLRGYPPGESRALLGLSRKTVVKIDECATIGVFRRLAGYAHVREEKRLGFLPVAIFARFNG